MPPAPQSTHARPSWPAPLKAALAAAAMLAASVLAYLPALGGAMLWDDDAHVTNASLRSLSGLWKIWFRLGTTQQYYPVLHSAFWVEHRLWGDSVVGYHLANVVLHAAAACLVAFALARVVPRSPMPALPTGADWFAAAVFALHPVCVESVAWISEQKNTLSAVFYLVSLLLYLRFDANRRAGWYLAALGLFALAVLTKSVTATLPAALLLVLLWRRGRLGWRRDVAPLIPWLAVGIAGGLFTAWVERAYIGARGGPFELGLGERTLLAGRVVWFYIGKLAWPAGLSFIYPRWHVVASPAWCAGLAGVAVLTVVLWRLRRWSAAPLVAFLFFVGSLFPALGFVNVYPFVFSYVADHWQYIPCIGILALGAEGAALAARRVAPTPAGRAASRVLAAAVLATLLALTRRQAALYRDVPTLYSDTLAKNPGCWMAHGNLGVYLMNQGRADDAIAHLREAIRIKPDYADAHNNLGNALSRIPGHLGESIAEFDAALSYDPGMAEAHGNLGLVLMRVPGRLAEGVAEMETALRGNEDYPGFAPLHRDLGAALAGIPGRLPDAIREDEAALRLDPGLDAARMNLGIALARAGRPGEAAPQFEAVLRAHPGEAAAQNDLGNVLSVLGRGPEAIQHYREALRLNPGSAEVHFNLGRSLRDVGDGGEAIAEFREALRLDAGHAEVWDGLGTALFRHGSYAEAAGAYAEAARLQPRSAVLLNNLGIALTRARRLGDAVSSLREAVRLDPALPDAHYNLGVALRALGEGDEAASEFRASGRTPP
jgi:tetratricopeptide (TPR) repeat protein